MRARPNPRSRTRGTEGRQHCDAACDSRSDWVLPMDSGLESKSLRASCGQRLGVWSDQGKGAKLDGNANLSLPSSASIQLLAADSARWRASASFTKVSRSMNRCDRRPPSSPRILTRARYLPSSVLVVSSVNAYPLNACCWLTPAPGLSERSVIAPANERSP